MNDQSPTTDAVPVKTRKYTPRKPKPLSQLKAKILTIRLTEKQSERLSAAALASDESLATWARTALLKAAEKQNS